MIDEMDFENRIVSPEYSGVDEDTEVTRSEEHTV